MKTSYLFALLFLGIISVNFSSCVKEDFDQPPEYDYPEIETNATIADIKAFYEPNKFVEIEDELIFDAIVVANDSTGNYFKSLVIQDETGGIELSINAVNLFNQFPVGRRIYINCKGLVISAYNNLIQLGGNTYVDDDGELRLGGIEEILIDQYIVKGAPGQEVKAREISSFSELKLEDQSTLVRLNNVQFSSSDTSSTYADDDQKSAYNLTIENCGGEEMTLRTSGYADFAGDNVPNKKGTITGIFSVFGTTKQLFIRKTSDVALTEARCGNTGGGGDCDYSEELMSIKQLRDLYTGTATDGPSGKRIKGIVISDRSNGTMQEQNVVIQGPNGYGVLVRFGEPNPYDLGDQFEILTAETDLSEYNGLLQLSNVNPANTCSSGKATVPEPALVTVADILDNMDKYESTLIKIKNATLQGGGTYGGAVTVNDGTGTITMYTRADAEFASDSYPTGSVTVTAIVSQFNDPQLSIRSKADVVSTGGGGGDDEVITLPVSTEFDDGIPSDWILANTKGTRVWEGRDYDGEFYAQMSAYSSEGTLDVTTWMITPKIDFESQSGEYIEVKLADAFQNGNPFRIMYSVDYFGGDPVAASWIEVGRDQIDPLINNSASYDNVYEPSGKIDLSSIPANAHIAFVYESGGSISTTIQLSSVNINK